MRHTTRRFRICLASLGSILACGSMPMNAAPLVIDSFDYASHAAARAAWVAQAGSPLVDMADSGEWGDERVMKLPCNFSVQASRCYWDRAVSLDLSAYRSFALEIYVEDPGAISAFTLYFHSGAGWYGRSASVTQPGWQTFYFPISDFTEEGTPAGWNQIDTIRLSPWKEAARDNFLAVRELRAFVPDLYIIRDTDTADQNTVEEVVTRHEQWLSYYNLSCSVIPNSLVQSNYLAGSQMVILPYNQVMPELMLEELERFVGAGGKLMVYYQMPARIQTLLGFKVTDWTQGDFAAFTFSDAVIQHLPSRVIQDSWNIMIAEPTTQLHARAIAAWEDSAGVPTGHPAWLASDNGLYMSHILLGDDAQTKPYMLLALIGHYIPAVWPTAAAAEIDRIGRIAAYRAYAEAVADIRAKAEPTLRVAHVAVQLDAAENARSQALAAFAAEEYPEAVQAAREARARLIEAYCLCQEPVLPEFRAVWEHSGTGPYPGNWSNAVSAIVSNGFHAIFPNMLWGGLAHYNSAILPHSDVYNTYGDQISACVTAAHAKGVEVHVWKVNWNLSTASQLFIDSMRAAGRTQVSSTGEPADWLCPSHPDNFALERDSMLEVVQNYDVDGIHFDYIRYPDGDHCYCDGCHTRFESDTGLTVANWPADILAAGSLRTSFLNWRRERITELVQAVHTVVHTNRPAVRVSAAVFSDYPSAYDGVGQDWVRWIDLGIVDFLCPMDYTEDHDRFRSLVTQQMNYAAGRIPIYPGIGAHVLAPDGVIRQILTTREEETGGFIIFNFDRDVAETYLPDVAAGTTARDEPDLDRDRIADAWETDVFGDTGVADHGSDFDGDGLSDREEYVVGTDATNAADFLRLDIRPHEDGLAVAFDGRATAGAGYTNIARHYRLESVTNLPAASSWDPVAGFTDRVVEAGVEEVLCPLAPIPDGPEFYRVRVRLQQTP